MRRLHYSTFLDARQIGRAANAQAVPAAALQLDFTGNVAALAQGNVVPIAQEWVINEASGVSCSDVQHSDLAIAPAGDVGGDHPRRRYSETFET